MTKAYSAKSAFEVTDSDGHTEFLTLDQATAILGS